MAAVEATAAAVDCACKVPRRTAKLTAANIHNTVCCLIAGYEVKESGVDHVTLC
jgi:hypothetical protein